MQLVSILKRHGIRPSKGLGQNFLVDEQVLERILAAGDLSAADIVLEIGPGVGLLTRRMAERVASVVAVELDRKLLPVLAEVLRDCANVRIVQGDILALDPVKTLEDALGSSGVSPLRYKVVANLPYYITSSALRHLLSARVRPEQMTIMLQREVAERIVAAPGNMSVLAISVQVYGSPEIVFRVPRGAFYPQPKVESAVLRVRTYPQPRVPEEELAHFFRVVNAGFAQRRKQLHNSLAHALNLPQARVLAALADARIEPDRRAQTLTIAEWAALARCLARSDVPDALESSCAN